MDLINAFTVLQGILGSVHSGKSALVHRYLTGSYMQEESPEGTYIEQYSINYTGVRRQNTNSQNF